METEAAALPITGNHEESSGDRRGDAGCARSFDCTFCKRGFSNAQALGGHMNMHRKDKAKLKAPPSRFCRFPFDVSGSTVAAASAATACSPVVVVVERSTPPRQPAGYRGGRASWCSAPAAPLALFADRVAWRGDGDDDSGVGGGGGRRGIDEENRGHEAELDLELRLGRSETNLRPSHEERN